MAAAAAGEAEPLSIRCHFDGIEQMLEMFVERCKINTEHHYFHKFSDNDQNKCND